ncbi:hypothetical protein DFR75_1011583 [Nocardia ignorata]|uniref:Uncharacterized protein n=1 Tax=Nocardia ignorata TaxID=145285 RepID=A0A4R6PU87_NOCIG|nr:hypothetical protein DFR75_1011583 [Nocardia ignorata]
MPLISAAVCPHPPALIPAVGGAAAAELDGLRAACIESIRRLRVPKFGAESDGWAVSTSEEFHSDPTLPDLLVIVGCDETTTAYESTKTFGSLRRYGIAWDWDIAWCRDDLSSLPLPLSLSVGVWLLTAHGPTGMFSRRVDYQSISFDASAEECAISGKDLAAQEANVAMLVVGEAAPLEQPTTHTAIRAADYNDALTRAFAQVDTTALSQLDPVESQTLKATGRAAWQVLAGAAAGRELEGHVLTDSASHNRGFVVASWTRAAGT